MVDDVPLREHLADLHRADLRWLAERDRRLEERDRRYSEVALEREKALKIKETADERALLLQSETQKYKDEKANDLRSQIERERGGYATKDELHAIEEKLLLAIKPLSEFIAGQRAGGARGESSRTLLMGLAGLAIALIVAIAAISPHLSFH
jgi:hypothetical protein